MLKEERQENIIRLLREKEYASVPLLSHTLYAGLSTIRRDLAELEKKGYIRRSRGGAMLLDNRYADTPFPFRFTTHEDDKKRLCELTATLVEDGDVLFIDESTTVQHLIKYIKQKKELTVITNSLTACTLLYQSGIKTFCTGGRLQDRTRSFVGNQAESFVADYSADYMFFSVSSLNEEGVVTDYSEEGAHLRRTMLRHARKKVLLCDSSKLGKNSAYRICTLDKLDYVVTNFDSGTDLSSFQSKKEKDGFYLFSKI